MQHLGRDHANGRVSLAALSDGQLMVEVGAGSVRAFAALYDRYSDRAYSVAMRVCRDGGHAEDAVQNAFLGIWNSRGSYREGRGPVSAWLLTIVRYRAVDIVRRNNAHASRLTPDGQHDACGVPDDVCEQIVALEEADDMRASLGRLPPAQREVIQLAFYGGLSHSEIAEQLGLPAGTVKGRMRLGLHKLEANLEAPIP